MQARNTGTEVPWLIKRSMGASAIKDSIRQGQATICYSLSSTRIILMRQNDPETRRVIKGESTPSRMQRRKIPLRLEEMGLVTVFNTRGRKFGRELLPGVRAR